MWPLAQTYTFRAAYCWIWPKFGQKGQIFCFWSDGLFLLPSFREPYKVSFGSMTSSSGSYCDLQLILKVFTFRAVTHYIRVRLLWENFERASPKLVLGKPITKPSKFFWFIAYSLNPSQKLKDIFSSHLKKNCPFDEEYQGC